MKISKEHEVWLIVGSQHLYGRETLETVASNAKELARTIDSNPETPIDLKFRQVVTTPSKNVDSGLEYSQQAFSTSAHSV
jgi:L-arabinose isomerase